jgi:hypothetical protein
MLAIRPYVISTDVDYMDNHSHKLPFQVCYQREGEWVISHVELINNKELVLNNLDKLTLESINRVVGVLPDNQELPLDEDQWVVVIKNNMIDQTVEAQLKFGYRIQIRCESTVIYTIESFDEIISEDDIEQIAIDWGTNKMGGQFSYYNISYDSEPFLMASIDFNKMKEKKNTLSAMIAFAQKYTSVGEGSVVKFHKEWWNENHENK